MRRIIVIALALVLACSFAVSASSVTVKAQATPLKVGLVTDTGKVDDRSFNQSAWEGAQQGAKEIGATADYIETLSTSDYANNIKLFVDKDYNVIVTVGFLMADATAQAAKDNPNVHFIGVDQFQATTLPNLTGLIFDESQPGFLAGVLAAHLTKSNIITGVYGADIPPVHRYRDGFEHGAQYVNPKIKVISTFYAGDASKAFNDPEWGATTAGQAMDQGADVVFGAGGKTGNGALQEAAKRTTKDKPLYCIGVDVDQWDTVPEAHPCLVSSAEKLIVPGMVTLLHKVADGSIPGGNYTGQSGIAPFHDFTTLIPADVAKELTDDAAQLASGALKSDGTKGTPATMAATMSGTMAATMMAATMAATAAK